MNLYRIDRRKWGQETDALPSSRAAVGRECEITNDRYSGLARATTSVSPIGLDLAQLQADMASPAIAQQISRDLADLQMLNISKTPEFRVNGKPLPSFGFDQLKELVDATLAGEYH